MYFSRGWRIIEFGGLIFPPKPHRQKRKIELSVIGEEREFLMCFEENDKGCATKTFRVCFPKMNHFVQEGSVGMIFGWKN